MTIIFGTQDLASTCVPLQVKDPKTKDFLEKMDGWVGFNFEFVGT